MGRYAKIENGEVTHICLAESIFWLENDQPGATFIDVTAQPDVAVGWAYDGDFTAPEPEAPQNRMQLTTAEFIEVFTPDEYLEISGMLNTHPVITQLYSVAQHQGTVNLESPKVELALDIFIDEGILTEARKAEILAGISP